MKILISDYVDSMMPYHDLEIKTLKEGLGDDIEVEVYVYSDDKREEFYEHLKDADALLTAFIQMNEEALDHAPNLKVISINATGFDNVDLDAADKRGIGVCPVGEYCTQDVSETAIAYMMALNKYLKGYQKMIDVDHNWDYAGLPANPRIENQTLGIVGFGKIGKCTAKKAKGLCAEIIAVDPNVDKEVADSLGVELTTKEDLLRRSDIIINHMCLTPENHHYFNSETFAMMEKKPIFINLGRGLSVDEGALQYALDNGQIRAAGMDVLYDETPDLANHPLVGRDNVLITPHSAFYSTTSTEDLMRLSSLNIVYFLTGKIEKVFKLVNLKK